jgi:hypothetical protein
MSTIALIKLSILIFLQRTFGPNRTFRIAVWCLIFLVICWWIGSMLSIIFQCTPISFYWNKNQSGHCRGSGGIVTFVPAVINVIYDFIIVVMPIPIVWKLDLPRARKLGICGIFLLGGVVTVTSIIRLPYIKNLKTYDLTCKSVLSHMTGIG